MNKQRAVIVFILVFLLGLILGWWLAVSQIIRGDMVIKVGEIVK